MILLMVSGEGQWISYYGNGTVNTADNPSSPQGQYTLDIHLNADGCGGGACITTIICFIKLYNTDFKVVAGLF